MNVDWSLLVILAFPPAYAFLIYRYVTSKYGVLEEEE